MIWHPQITKLNPVSPFYDLSEPLDSLRVPPFTTISNRHNYHAESRVSRAYTLPHGQYSEVATAPSPA